MKKMSNKKMIIISVAVVTLAGLVVFVGGKLLQKNDNHAATITPTPVVIVTPVASPSVSPEVTVSPEVSKDPSEGDKPTATPSAKPSVKPTATPKPTTKPTATPTPKPTTKPTPTPVPPAPKPEEKPVLCSADGANPELPCDVIVGNYEGMTMFEGDFYEPGNDASFPACKAWGESINPDDYPGLRSYYCGGVVRNDGSSWGTAGMLVY